MLTLQQTNQQRTVIHRVFYQRSACHRALVRKLSTLNANVLTIRRKGLLTDAVRDDWEEDICRFT